MQKEVPKSLRERKTSRHLDFENFRKQITSHKTGNFFLQKINLINQKLDYSKCVKGTKKRGKKQQMSSSFLKPWTIYPYHIQQVSFTTERFSVSHQPMMAACLLVKFLKKHFHTFSCAYAWKGLPESICKITSSLFKNPP